jgi:surfeit locus 1 family protein
MPYFRPLPTLTFACALLFATLIALGVWQLDRLQWKLGLIARVDNLLSAPPVSIGEAYGDAMDVPPEEHIAAADYRRVRLRGHFLNNREFYVFTTGLDGSPVYHVITPLVVPGLFAFLRCSVCTQIQPNGRAELMIGKQIVRHPDGVVFVDRGYVPLSLLSPGSRTAGLLEGDRTIVGVLRAPDQPGWFTPKPDYVRRIFYVRDLHAMKMELNRKAVFPMVVEADAAPNPGGWPKGGQTRVTFRNEHLQYAITWFALAAGLMGVYIAYHISRGRLGWKQ